jgi:chemotaxis protein methyltransferase CheR
MSVLRLHNFVDYLAYLKRHGETRYELQKLLRFLTVGETCFFRYNNHFEELKERLVKATTDTPIRIWSAGCSTGEEPYSIAICIMEALPDWRSRDIRILATDINLQSLARARAGAYSAWSLRNTEPRRLERFFERRGGSFVIKEEVKHLVQFHQVNLSSRSRGALSADLTGLDAIFCRNVLIYFAPEAAKDVLQSFADSLKPQGCLFLGHAETLLQRSPELQTVRRAESYFYVKSAPSNHDAPADELPPPVLRPLAPPTTAAPPLSLADARKLFEAGELDAALKVLAGVAPAPAELPEADILEGFILVKKGNLQEALRCCHRAIARDDLNPDAYFLKGVVLEGCECFSEAADQYRRALLLDRDFIMPRFHMGRLHLRCGRVREAAREIRNVIRILAKCHDEGTIPYSGGISRGVWIEQLETVLAQVA